MEVSAPSASLLFLGVVGVGSTVLGFVRRQHMEFNGLLQESEWCRLIVS
jgi:hypothetical protein